MQGPFFNTPPVLAVTGCAYAAVEQSVEALGRNPGQKALSESWTRAQLRLAHCMCVLVLANIDPSSIMRVGSSAVVAIAYCLADAVVSLSRSIASMLE